MALCEPSSSNSSATGKGLHPLIDAPLECTTEAAEMPMQLQSFLSFGSSLIVDDCPMMQWLTQAMFEEWGATAVTVASDGQEAVNILCQAAGHEQSWLVIMDVQVAKLNITAVSAQALLSRPFAHRRNIVADRRLQLVYSSACIDALLAMGHGLVRCVPFCLPFIP
eukprot:4576950-Pleurochrysis_carterae.AAC.4